VSRLASATTYLALDAKGRRAFLADTIAKVKSEDAKPFQDGKPAYLDKIEWLHRPTDMCRVMNWLRQQTEADKTARQILAINPGSTLTSPTRSGSTSAQKAGRNQVC